MVVSEHPGIPLPYLASVLRRHEQTAERANPSESPKDSPTESDKPPFKLNKLHPSLVVHPQVYRQFNPGWEPALQVELRDRLLASM